MVLGPAKFFLGSCSTVGTVLICETLIMEALAFTGSLTSDTQFETGAATAGWLAAKLDSSHTSRKLCWVPTRADGAVIGNKTKQIDLVHTKSRIE